MEMKRNAKWQFVPTKENIYYRLKNHKFVEVEE